MNTEHMTNGHVRFAAVMEFELTDEEVSDVLVQSIDRRPEALGKLLADKYGLPRHTCYNVDSLAEAFGVKLARQKVEERRMLTAPKDVAVPMESEVT